jgi:hypothetical protein
MSGMGEKQLGSVIKVHLLSGDPRGSRVLAATHSNTKGIAVPRSEYEAMSRELEDFSRAGVYVLVYPPPETSASVFSERVYVGQADVAKERIDAHHRDPAKDWTWVALFTSRDKTMNNVYAQFLEARLVGLARSARRAELVNRNDPQEPTLDAEDRDTASHFLGDIVVYSPILGINAFEVPPSPPSIVAPPPFGMAGLTEIEVGRAESLATRSVVYHLQRLPEAKGTNTPSGFVVFKDSPLRMIVAPSAEEAGVSRKRDELLKQEVLVSAADGLKFARDFTFDSPSAAAMLVLGNVTSGRTEWRDKSDRTLNEVESAGV